MMWNHARLGYNITLNVAPIALGGKFLANLAITTPLSPWALAILPQIHLYALLWVLSVALYI